MFTENLDDFIATADFAITATIGASSVAGIFDNGYGVAMEFAAGSKPSLICQVADLPAITLGTTACVIDGNTYTIVENQPDGFGLTTLVLEDS